jgi:3-polyprenyl-4-hydroxybenzoate decarboxylase
MAMDPRRIAVGVTGASGAIYAVRTIAALLEAGCALEIVFSDYGKRLLLDELGPDAKVERLSELMAARYGEGIGAGRSSCTATRIWARRSRAGATRVTAWSSCRVR